MSSMHIRARRLRHFGGRLAANSDGGIAIISAALFLVAIAASALAIDVGSLFLEKRRVQGIVDLAAMAAAADLTHATAAAQATMTVNKIDMSNGSLAVELGHYEPDISTVVAARFQVGVLPYNAARVTVTKPAQIFFAKTFSGDCCTMSVTAMAANAQLATFSLGSRLAALNGGVINSVLGSMLGGSLSLSLVDYNGIASANVGMFSFLQALATELHITGGTYNDVLNANAKVGNVINALAAVTQSNGQSTASAALKKIATQSSAASLSIPLNSVLSLGPLGNLNVGDALSGKDSFFNVMDLVSATSSIASAGKFLSVDLGATVPGVASLKLDISIGEPAQQSPWAAVGQPQATVHTAQVRVRLTADVGGTGILAATKVHLPIYISGAYADGRLAQINCAADGTGSVTVAAKPGIASASIGDVSNADLTNFSVTPSPTKTQMVTLAPLISVKGYAGPIQVTNTSESQLTFSRNDINNLTIKRVSTQNITETLVSSLVSNLQLELGPLTLGAVTPLIGSILTPVAAPLDQVVYSLLTTLGIRLGEVDVRVHGVFCRGSVFGGLRLNPNQVVRRALLSIRQMERHRHGQSANQGSIPGSA